MPYYSRFHMPVGFPDVIVRTGAARILQEASTTNTRRPHAVESLDGRSGAQAGSLAAWLTALLLAAGCWCAAGWASCRLSSYTAKLTICATVQPMKTMG